MAIHVVKEPVPKPGTLGRTELYALAIRQVIGAGVITLIVPAIKMTGYSAWLAYFVAILMGFVMILPFVFISSTLRLGGGNYSMLCDLSSPRTSGIFAYMYLTQCLSLSLFGASAAAYLGDIIPALNSHWARVIVGVTLLTFFYVVNLMGVDIMAKAQKMMTWLLIAALILFAIVGIFKMKLPIFDFSDPNFAINGWGITFNNGQISGGFLGAVLLFVYSTQGYYMTTAYGRDSKNARKDIPFVPLLCVPTLCILYVGVAMAGVGVMSVEEYGNSTTLVFAAQRIFPTWLFYFFIIGGPIMALLSTLNSSFAYNSITIGQSCDDGWDYTLYHSDFSVMDGGQVDAPELTIQEVREQILEAHHMEKGRRLLQDYDFVMDRAAEAEELCANNRPSTLEKLASLVGAKEKCDVPECSPVGCRKARDAHEL